jgi:hypothetical protein
MNTLAQRLSLRAITRAEIRATIIRAQYVAFTVAVALLVPSPASAQSVPIGTGICSGGSSNVGGFNLGSLTTILQSLADLFANTYIKIGVIIGIAIGVMLLFFDGGQLPQVAKTVVGGLVAVALVFALIGYIVGSNTGCGPATASAALVTWLAA